MTDAEVVCSWMEPKPSDSPLEKLNIGAEDISAFSWPTFWDQSNYLDAWEPVHLTLDRLHIVEERLTDEQWEQYLDLVAGCKLYRFRKVLDYADVKSWVHAEAERKIKALATVLRPEVERG